MKIYLSEEEVEELDELGYIEHKFLELYDTVFVYPVLNIILKTKNQGYPFSMRVEKEVVIEAMYHGGVLIRPYEASIDYALEAYELM